MTEAGYWTKELRRMYDQHYPELDHKDCANIADLLEEMTEEIDKRFTMDEIRGAWKEQNEYMGPLYEVENLNYFIRSLREQKEKESE